MRLDIFVDVHLNSPFPQLKDLKSAWEAVRPTLDSNEKDSGTASSSNQYGTAPEWGKGESTTDMFRGIDQSYSW